MEQRPQHEQHPGADWMHDVYAHVSDIEYESVVPDRADRLLQTLLTYPRPDATDDFSRHPKRQFRMFAVEFLAASPDPEVLGQRLEFLLDPDLIHHYAVTARRSSARSLSRLRDAAETSMDGLAAFCTQHPGDKEAAINHVVGAFQRASNANSFKPTSSLSNIVGAHGASFREKLVGGYFEDMLKTERERFTVACLDRMNYGEKFIRLSDTGIHDALYAPLDISKIYAVRNLAAVLDEAIIGREQNSRVDPTKGYRFTSVAKLFGDAYEMLRRAAQYTEAQGSRASGELLAQLPSQTSHSDRSPRERVIAMANGLTPQINKQFFATRADLQLQRLKTSEINSLPLAFDRIFFVLHKLLAQSIQRTSALQQHTILREAGYCASSLVEFGHARIDADAPTTIGDIVAMFPEASGPALEKIIQTTQRQLGGQAQRGSAVYRAYRGQVRNVRRLKWKRWQSGFGFLS